MSSNDTAYYTLSNIQTIVVDSQYAAAVDDSMDTLIPPSLFDFASTFATDLRSLFVIDATVINGSGSDALPEDSVFLTLAPDAASHYLGASGEPSSEGYTLSVTTTGIVITGASPLGAWWGTRTVLQQAALHEGAPGLAVGAGTDTPGWATRGMMLDAGRHFYPVGFLTELCAYMSFFKQNTLHLHLSDNLYNNVDIYSRERSLSLYARFRLWSDAEALAGLNKYPNESYTRADFDEIQTSCAARGVTVLPEIEAPGHALVIVQWKPEIGYATDLSLLNISHPETLPTIKTIWGEFLPWFHTKVVSIGADEYTGPSTDYNTFVNAMASYIGAASGKFIRIWGTFPPDFDNATYENVYQNVSVQHWEYFEDNPYYDYILNNYSVVNSNDDFYIVNKWAPPGGYLNHINLTKTFRGTPPGATAWRPNVFDQANATNNPPASDGRVLGSIVPLWNDYGANASVYSEAYYAWRDGIPALADKQWGGNLSTTDFASIFETLRAAAPGQNLDRAIASVSDVIFDYTFTDDGSSFADTSPNAFSVATNCSTAATELLLTPSCAITTPHDSKGRNYTLTLSGLTITSLDDPANATLLTGSDSTLLLTPNITFFAGGNYFSLNSTVPLHETVDLHIIGRGNRTYASVGSATQGTLVDEEEFLAVMGINGLYHHWAEVAFEAPLRTVGGPGSGWSGKLRGFSLTSVA